MNFDGTEAVNNFIYLLPFYDDDVEDIVKIP